MASSQADGQSIVPSIRVEKGEHVSSTTESDAQPIPKQSIRLDPGTLPRQRKTSIYDESHYGTQFSERLELLVDKFEYQPSGTEPGKILIFYHEEYDPSMETDNRRGGRRDVNEIIICFQRLGFNISKNNIHKDCTKEQINSILDNVCEEDFTNTNCLIVFFLSHGKAKDEISVYDGHVKTKDIWNKFATCETLNKKPKMFVFQACKGKETAKISADKPTLEKELVSETHFSTGEIGPDILLVYSTLEGDKAFRDTKTGSWFIQELCKNFSSYGRRDDVLSLLIRTAKCVANSYSNVTGLEVVEKQMPIFVSTLRRKFYINRNKDRHFLLQILKSKKENLEELKKIGEIVNDIDSILGLPIKL